MGDDALVAVICEEYSAGRFPRLKMGAIFFERSFLCERDATFMEGVAAEVAELLYLAHLLSKC